ncbi:MAG: hypothetical protein KBD16_02710 [Candidatus Pacebacteria bacterium]|nr:hypothetical protein [Candidatus Paceibacterota bacterium]
MTKWVKKCKILSEQINNSSSGRRDMPHEPLKPDDIAVGKYIWYSGSTALDAWDCPAVITHVDFEQRIFKIRSLDDMKEQALSYTFELEEHSPPSRVSMRAISTAEAREYVRARKPIFKEEVRASKLDPRQMTQRLLTFEREARRLGLA